MAGTCHAFAPRQSSSLSTDPGCSPVPVGVIAGWGRYWLCAAGHGFGTAWLLSLLQHHELCVCAHTPGLVA